MKMQKVCAWLLGAALCLLLAGCGSQNTAESQAPADANQEAASQDANTAPDTQQRQADLSGEVESIVGNEVTLALIEMPEMPGNMGDRTNPADNSQTNRGDGNPPGDFANMTEEERQALREQRQSEGGSMPSGSRPQMELTYTGETKTIVIPPGVTISGFGRQGSELEISDIQAGAILMVWFADGDTGESGTVETVRMMQQPGSN